MPPKKATTSGGEDPYFRMNMELLQLLQNNKRDEATALAEAMVAQFDAEMPEDCPARALLILKAEYPVESSSESEEDDAESEEEEEEEEEEEAEDSSTESEGDEEDDDEDDDSSDEEEEDEDSSDEEGEEKAVEVQLEGILSQVRTASAALKKGKMKKPVPPSTRPPQRPSLTKGGQPSGPTDAAGKNKKSSKGPQRERKTSIIAPEDKEEGMEEAVSAEERAIMDQIDSQVDREMQRLAIARKNR